MNPHPFRCLITAGPTREHIDPVRFISNPSSGKMGYALAEQASKMGWTVDLVSGPVTIPPPNNVNLHSVTSADEMYEACKKLFTQSDMLIMCAAVSDMKPAKQHNQKQKKKTIEWEIQFKPTIDILKTLSQLKDKQTLVGFAAETENIQSYAKSKLEDKKLDWIVANDVSGTQTGFASDQNKVTLISKSGQTVTFGPKSKLEIANDILNTVKCVNLKNKNLS